jgi:hypothetical protein
MHKSATKCNETLSKWCKNKHGASKIMDTLETYQLLTVDLLVKSAMEEGILDIQLVNRPRPRESNAEDNVDRGLHDDGAESLIKVDPRLLTEAANHPASLVAGKAVIGVELVLVDHFL